ncbi:hypothetical protein, partial [Streptomyces sp. NPDC005568]|uniref:hypothetical protein n=1 Tax=Streptomyces sp. NPDC005568 TaxID=3156887 RepID=UPI0033BF5BE1
GRRRTPPPVRRCRARAPRGRTPCARGPRSPALPVLAFVALLALIVNPSDAHATAGDPALTHVVERIQEAVRR